MKLVIFGPQGSGKGTQAEVISQKLNLPAVVMGDLIRVEIKSASELGNKISSLVSQGNLIPDELALGLLKERLVSPDCAGGFIIDGYPRTLKQAQLLNDVVEIDQALEIWISDEEAIKRISGRRTCSTCGQIYHLEYNPPATEAVCNKCGGQLIVREDDKEEVIKNRLKLYHEQTEPVIDYYQAQAKHLKINGMQGIEEVSQEIFTNLNIS